MHFKRIPTILEAHHVFDKETQIAQQELNEVESIDDPNWKRLSFMTHMLLQVDLTIQLAAEERVDISELVPDELEPESPFFISSLSTDESISVSTNPSVTDNTTIIERLFWEYLSRTNYGRNTSKISKYLTYEEVISGQLNSRKGQTVDVDRM